MKQPDLDGLTAEQSEYVKWLEDGRSGASDLIIELNLTSKVFADDLRLIRTNEGQDALYIGKSDKTKKFEHAMTLFDKIDKIKALASYFKAEEKEKTTGNTFEDVSAKVKAKLNGGK